jgi:ABC-type nitrate/sulfonate/bicarbonate transport system permease component
MEKTIMNISSIILALVAVALLGISVYSLLSYIKERRAMRFKSFRQR